MPMSLSCQSLKDFRWPIPIRASRRLRNLLKKAPIPDNRPPAREARKRDDVQSKALIFFPSPLLH